MRTHLFLALFWLLAAGFIFGYPIYEPTAPRYNILQTEWSIGWLLLAFGAWNLIRWWLSRASDGSRAKDRPAPSEDSPKMP